MERRRPTRPRPGGTPDAYEAIFTGLAHPARRRILITLHFGGGSLPAGAIAALFAHSWPTTTRHLHVLEAAGLLRATRRGRSRTYRIERRGLALVRDWIGCLIRPTA